MSVNRHSTCTLQHKNQPLLTYSITARSCQSPTGEPRYKLQNTLNNKMASILHCLLRSCFEEENEAQGERTPYEPPSATRMHRSAHYESTLHGDESDDHEDDGDCCRPEPGAENDGGGLQLFLRHVFSRRYESIEPVEETSSPGAHSTSTDPPFPRSAPFGIFRRTNSGGVAKAEEKKPSLLSLSRSPLRTASSFRHSKGLPAIDPEEVVIPGSALQHEMAASMSSTLEEQGDECVICMEGFDATNPRMPTLCGCGENKTYFHLPCLYQWIEQSRECPSCRKRLRWEEF
jgi:hypothetical protein